MNKIITSADQAQALARAQKESQGTQISEDALEVLLMHELLKKKSRQEQDYS